MLLIFFLLVVLISWGVIPFILIILPFLLIDCNLLLFIYSLFCPKRAFENKCIWLTGASSGIGEELAYQLAKRGARLILSARRESELERVRNNCQDSDKHIIVPLDLENIASHTDIAAKVFTMVGRVDIFINNAGRGQQSLAENTILAVDELLIRTNTLGSISITKAILPHLLAQHKKGKPKAQIIVISSLAGKFPSPTCTGYAASKHALHGFFTSLGVELPDLDISMVCPGPIISPINERSLAFNGKLLKDANVNPIDIKNGMMKTARCAYLIAVAIYWRSKEVWIAKTQFLISIYLSQYSPIFYSFILSLAGPQYVKKFRASQPQQE